MPSGPLGFPRRRPPVVGQSIAQPMSNQIPPPRVVNLQKINLPDKIVKHFDMEMALILGHERFASALCLVPMSVQIWPMNLSACRRISCCCWPVGGTARAAKGWPNELDEQGRERGFVQCWPLQQRVGQPKPKASNDVPPMSGSTSSDSFTHY